VCACCKQVCTSTVCIRVAGAPAVYVPEVYELETDADLVFALVACDKCALSRSFSQTRDAQKHGSEILHF
jgi:hypothetical protein